MFSMRRKIILFASLPLAMSLSLANFQDITSILVPITCQLTYDSQIPSCQVSDFKSPGCSEECAAALTSVAESVSQACSDVTVNFNTLLGIIKNGGILQALCPILQAASPPQTATSTQLQESAQPTDADSVTLPTTSPGVVVSTTTTSKFAPIEQSSASTTSSHKPSSTKQVSTLQSLEPTDETTAAAFTPTAAATYTSTSSQDLRRSTTSSKATLSTKKAQAESSGGGGSPFDISSNTGNKVERGTMVAFVVAAWAGILLR